MDTEQDFNELGQVNPIANKDGLDVYRNPLTFDIDDDTFLLYAKQLKRDDDAFWNDKGTNDLTLAQRRLQNEMYLFGRQKVGYKWRKYDSKAQDNILWEGEAYLR